MNKITRLIWVVGVLVLAGFCLSSCDRTLDVQTAFPFEVETMPVREEIALGETAEIRCLLKSEGDFSDTRYTIRYFQPEGEGKLRLDGIVFEPNDRYPLESKSFRLYYTSRSTDRQLIDIYIEDNHGQLQHLSFDFNNKRIEQ
ncbi:DUF3872 domain-containing protein [Porphyromonas levii]|uniref:DUF3872 domain-containing protein n=1 Tax=Porphyromonas levii TaxID=28114 RepID=UPI001B8BD868|nr:DUF3872 domain-containing protein [Porphyromonas levii]MBR8758708.1 hypothetical protein [Porphyromonas levii]